MHYRKGNIEDLGALMELGLLSYAEYIPDLSRENWEKIKNFMSNEEAFVQLIDQSDVFVCETDGRIVGMVYLVPGGNPTDLFKAEWAHIRLLGVDPDYRGKGIGRRLTAQCIAQAKQNGEQYLALHTSEFMDAARALYESLGFEQQRSFVHLGRQYWIYLMGLSLEQGRFQPDKQQQ